MGVCIHRRNHGQAAILAREPLESCLAEPVGSRWLRRCAGLPHNQLVSCASARIIIPRPGTCFLPCCSFGCLKTLLNLKMKIPCIYTHRMQGNGNKLLLYISLHMEKTHPLKSKAFFKKLICMRTTFLRRNSLRKKKTWNKNIKSMNQTLFILGLKKCI